MGNIKTTENSKCWQGCGETGSFVCSRWKYKVVQSLGKTIWRFLKKLKIKLSYDPAIPLVDIYTKEFKARS